MPSQTFLNLPDQKRNHITQLALAEFASHDYDSASITNLVKQAKIAKGSFYQYFEDKKDLYLYLVEMATQEKLSALQTAERPQAEMSFFVHLRWLFSAATAFNFSHPKLSQIINRAIYGDVPFREEVLRKTHEVSTSYLHGLVVQGIERGDLDRRTDPDLAVFAIQALSDGMRTFVPRQLALKPETLAEGAPQSLDMVALNQIYDDVIQLLERGLGGATGVERSQLNDSLQDNATPH
ncbi:MAG: TetR/AcrR family transcriptional regulator [Synechococcales cyanobacterium CRU_2_2]|nr:TetR/AcrR family transcriptional regulator [Synechococcales cyanobacterium CRU_2_2]